MPLDTKKKKNNNNQNPIQNGIHRSNLTHEAIWKTQQFGNHGW